jgi:hypothetical protein
MCGFKAGMICIRITFELDSILQLSQLCFLSRKQGKLKTKKPDKLLNQVQYKLSGLIILCELNLSSYTIPNPIDHDSGLQAINQSGRYLRV